MRISFPSLATRGESFWCARTSTLLALAIAAAAPAALHAQDARKDTLVVANELGPNMLDIHALGASFFSYGVAWVAYDRLMTYGKKPLPGGAFTYDFQKLEPELAERWVMDKDGGGVTFHLRKNAVFHDGTPVTAKDVKWSLDRAIAMGGFPQFQMAAGSLEKPEQFTVVNEHAVHVKFLRPDRMTMPDLAVPVASIYNSSLALKHATPTDPWAAAWLKGNTAGGGAYKVESWRPGQEIVFTRFDEWKSGPLPKIRRVIQRDVPNAATRRALLLRGDADMTYQLPPKDFAELAADQSTLKVVSVPVENALYYLGINTKRPPFDNAKVRQAIAYAIPYEQIHRNALFGRGVKMWGGSMEPTTTAWPQPSGYTTDLAKAKALMAEAGFANGTDSTLSFDLSGSNVNEPAALLIQEALAQIGIRVQLNKVPGATWRSSLLKKDMPLLLNRFGGWLNYPEYYFFWGYHGQNAVFNTMAYQDAQMDRHITNARFPENKAVYDDQVKAMIRKAWSDVPRIPIVQPVQDVAMQKNISGFTYWFHLQPDYRQLVKN
ncbi:MAG: ABC transporter substrate-binding protein [Hydrogenophaga sp.]|nr:ABC transporter substrate-binding protein [Hydrogenophaga sp.]